MARESIGTVRNISGGGAALDVANAAVIPPTFRLAIKADDFLARCRVVLEQRQSLAPRSTERIRRKTKDN